MPVQMFEIDEKLFRRFSSVVTRLNHTSDRAVGLALKEWCDNREYLLSSVGKQRFPAAALLIKQESSYESKRSTTNH